jgi:hypothetical protein
MRSNSQSRKPSLLKTIVSSAKSLDYKSIAKNTVKQTGAITAVFGVLDYLNRREKGQSVAQSGVSVTAGVLSGLGAVALGTAIGTMVAPVLGSLVGGGVGLLVSMIGGYLGYKASTSITDSFFSNKPSSSSSSFNLQSYTSSGMTGGGGISSTLNKQKPIGTPVETSMVDMTPTTFKSPSNSLSNISPNYGMTSSIARESVVTNTATKSLVGTALMQNTVKEKEKSDDDEQTGPNKKKQTRKESPVSIKINEKGSSSSSSKKNSHSASEKNDPTTRTSQTKILIGMSWN